MHGIKETKEALVGLNELSLLLINAFKDGVQLGQDSAAIWSKFTTDPVFAAKMAAAYDNFQAIPEEVKDLDPRESVELAKTQLDFIPAIIEAFKKG